MPIFRSNFQFSFYGAFRRLQWGCRQHLCGASTKAGLSDGIGIDQQQETGNFRTAAAGINHLSKSGLEDFTYAFTTPSVDLLGEIINSAKRVRARAWHRKITPVAPLSIVFFRPVAHAFPFRRKARPSLQQCRPIVLLWRVECGIP